MIKEYPEDSNDLPLKLTPPYAAMASAYAQLFDDPDTADVCFIIHHPSASDPGPQFIHAHSKILAARATYFATSESFIAIPRCSHWRTNYLS